MEEFHRGSNKRNLGRDVFASNKRVCSSISQVDSNSADSYNSAKKARIGQMFQAVIPELTYDSVDRDDVLY